MNCKYCDLPKADWHSQDPPICQHCWDIAFKMGDEILYCPSPKQELFHARTEPNVLFWGGRGSGKSQALRWEAHIRAMAYPGFKYCILRRTFPQLEESHLKFIAAEMKKLGGYFLWSTKTAHYPNGSTGRFGHCSTEEDVLNLLSAEYYWMAFDELSTFPWEMFTKLAASVRVLKGSGLTAFVRAATNPLGPSAAEINKYFVLKDVTFEEDERYNPSEWYSVKANATDNPHLDLEQYTKRFGVGLPAHVRRAWVDGDFVLENALFDFFPTKDGKPYHVINDIELKKIVEASQIYRAFDAGWFPDPSLCLWIAHLGNRYIVIKEKLWYKTIAPDIADDIKSIDHDLGISRVVTTYCDPTMDIHTPADIRTLREIFELHGIPMEPSINNREMFASAVHIALAEEAALGTPRLQIYQHGRDGGCPYLVKTIPQMRFNPKRPMAMDDHKDDHGVVSLAYFLMSHASSERRSLSSKSLRPWQKPKGTGHWNLGNESVKDRS